MKKLNVLLLLVGTIFLLTPKASNAENVDANDLNNKNIGDFISRSNDPNLLREAMNSDSVKNPKTCDMKSDEALVCEVVLCNPLGLITSESRSDCLKTNRRFAIYLAKLGPWDKPPKCKMRDKDCNKTGKAKSANIDVDFCDELDNFDERNTCRNTLGYPLLNPNPNPEPPTYPRPPIDPCRDDFRKNIIDCDRKEF
ncbi:MAG: hypothetical protein ACTJIB_10420 [Pseudoalteromonas prydzensis]|uniref:hypothetical protein n=1 Tax=Pseudoalteromonas prydzensis TaxID=182141 RepID=UPI003F991582